MNVMLRQTTFGVEEIKKLIDDQCEQPYPQCLLVNELGVIAKTGDPDESAIAQEVLADLLNSEEMEDRWISIRLLKTVQMLGKSTPKASLAIATFEGKSENADIIPTPEEIHYFVEQLH